MSRSLPRAQPSPQCEDEDSTNPLVTHPSVDATKTRAFIHPKDPNAMSAIEYMNYANNLALADQVRATHNMIETLFSNLEGGRYTIAGRRSLSRSPGRASSLASDEVGEELDFGEDEDGYTPYRGRRRPGAKKTPPGVRGMATKVLDQEGAMDLLQKAYDDWINVQKRNVRKARSSSMEELYKDVNDFFGDQCSRMANASDQNVLTDIIAVDVEGQVEVYLRIGRKWAESNEETALKNMLQRKITTTTKAREGEKAKAKRKRAPSKVRISVPGEAEPRHPESSPVVPAFPGEEAEESDSEPVTKKSRLESNTRRERGDGLERE